MMLDLRSFRSAEGIPVCGSNCAFSVTGASFRKSQILLNVYCGRSDQKGASTESRRVNSPPIFIVWAWTIFVSTSFPAYVHWSKPLKEPIPNCLTETLPAALKLAMGKPQGALGF